MRALSAGWREGALLVLVLTGASGAPAEAPPESAPVALTDVAPRSLVAGVGRRLGGEFAAAEFTVQEVEVVERLAAANHWLDEVFAPLAAPGCSDLLAAAGLPLRSAAALSSEQLGSDRPVAGPPRADVILLPRRLSPLTAANVERLRTTGLLPFEFALAGECARAVGARHAGPPPGDGLLRLARAARLEGLARLAGIVLAARGAGVEAADLGVSVLTLDKDEAGLPRSGPAVDRVRSALLRTFYDDGLRWAAFHYFKDGLPGVIAALERPAVGPAALLRPGLRRVGGPMPAGCSLGPRAAAALLTGDDDAAWIGALIGDSWRVDADGAPTVWLAFDDEQSAARAQEDLAARDLLGRRDGAALRIRSPKGLQARPPAP